MRMDRDARQKAYSSLLDLSARQGYITFDNIMSSADKWNLAISAVDWLSSEIATRGILIYDGDPATSSSVADDYDDYAQSDYEDIFRKAVEIEPSLEQIVGEIKNIVPPQFKEISKLKYQIKEGNSYARQRMIEMHLRLAVKIAVQRAAVFDAQLADTLGWACIGLVIAVDRYDPDTNGAFGSYASLWMLQNISREQPTQNPDIYFPVHKREGYYTVYPELKERGCTMCDKITQCAKLNAYIEDKLGCTPEQVQDVLLAAIPPCSLEMFSENIDELSENTFEAENAFCDNEKLDEVIDEHSLKEIIADALSTLSEREREVIIARYGLNGDKEKTLEEVGAIYNLTRERIRQIEKKALKRLRHYSRSKKLRDYY